MTQELSRAASAQIERFLGELQRWGRRTNLVGSTDSAELRIHVEDSLAAAPHFPAGASVVDLGSGAGFPGLPIQLARPDLKMTLVEIRERRWHFLRRVIRELELPCDVLRRKIEEPPSERFDVATLRAVGPLAECVPLAARWVNPQGEIWIWTREKSPFSAKAEVGEISLADRGRILRVHAAEVSCGTP